MEENGAYTEKENNKIKTTAIRTRYLRPHMKVVLHEKKKTCKTSHHDSEARRIRARSHPNGGSVSEDSLATSTNILTAAHAVCQYF